MSEVTINGLVRTFSEGTTILAACRQLGIEIPALCHDERLKPSGACRLCVVEIEGWNRHAPACHTTLLEGMEIRTHSPAVEKVRRTLLELLARDYPAEAVSDWPDKEFHQCLRTYGVSAKGRDRTEIGARLPPFRDDTHPYLHADLSKCITCFRCVQICDDVQGQFVWRAWDRGIATRIRPGDAPTLLDSDCVSCGACVDSCPTGALEDQSVLRHGSPTRWTRTTCPYCGVGCEMSVGTREGRIVQVKPVLDAPVSKGHLCVKGRYAFDFTHAADRVTEPMIRRGSEWRKVSWAEAIECVVSNFRRMLDTTGPDSLAVLGSARGTNEENYLAQKFARVVLGTNNVDCCARVCHSPSAAAMTQMLGTGAATNSFDDIERASAFLICGCNPTENHPIVGARIKQAVLRGAKLIVVDPRAIELTRHADIHLRVRPGTNVALLNALTHVIVAETLVDETALRDRVSEFAAFREFIGAWTPERAAEVTGVPAGVIREAARLYATHKPAMCFHGLGITEHTQGTDGVMCLVNLALLTGNFGKTGTGVNPLRGQNNVQGAAHMGCEPGNFTGSVPLDLGHEMFEAAWQSLVPRAPGLSLMEMMDAAVAGQLKGLWTIGWDIALTNPNAARTRAALSRLEFVVVQDLFVNEVAREFGHVFLPACSSFEKDGTFMNAERRVQRVRKVLEPVGDSKPDWEIICEVAKAMAARASPASSARDVDRGNVSRAGAPAGTGFDFTSPEEIWNEIRRVWRAGAGISYARLERGGLQWPCPSEDHPGTAVLHATTFPRGSRASLERVQFAPTGETVTDEFPFLLTTGRTLYQFNAGTMTMRTPNVRLREHDTLDIAPADAGRLGLHDGERVRVSSRHGETILPLRLDARVKAGELFATFHTVEAFLNRLTSSRRDRVVLTPEYKIVAVNLRKEQV